MRHRGHDEASSGGSCDPPGQQFVPGGHEKERLQEIWPGDPEDYLERLVEELWRATVFVEGTAVHSAEVLRQTASEFQRLHLARVAFDLAAVSLFVGFLRYYRYRIISEGAHRGQ